MSMSFDSAGMLLSITRGNVAFVRCSPGPGHALTCWPVIDELGAPTAQSLRRVADRPGLLGDAVRPVTAR